MTKIGTHNSSAYQVNFEDSSFKKYNKWWWLNKFSFLPCISRKIVNDTVCQDRNIYGQAYGRVQALDLRISLNAKNEWVCSHTFQTADLREVISDIRTIFWKLVIFIEFDFEHRDQITPELELKFLKLWWKIPIPQHLVYYTPVNPQVLNSCSYIYYNYDPLQFRVNNFKKIWFNVDNPEDYFQRLDQVEDWKNTVFYGVLTPQNTCKSLVSSESIRKFAEEINTKTLEYFNSLLSEGPDYLFLDYYA